MHGILNAQRSVLGLYPGKEKLGTFPLKSLEAWYRTTINTTVDI